MWKKQFNGFVAMLQFYSNEWTIFLSVEEVLLWRHQPIFCTSFPAGEEPLPCARPQEVLSSESPRNIKITRVRSSRFIFLLLLMKLVLKPGMDGNFSALQFFLFPSLLFHWKGMQTCREDKNHQKCDVMNANLKM